VPVPRRVVIKVTSRSLLSQLCLSGIIIVIYDDRIYFMRNNSLL